MLISPIGREVNQIPAQRPEAPTSVKRLVYYSVALEGSGPQRVLWQLEVSIRSLRRFNPSIRVILFVYGALPPRLRNVLGELDVTICDQGSYERRLAGLTPRGSKILARYPVTHRFLNLSELAPLAPEHVLVVDADTIFFGDVDVLFDRYSEADCYAREEPHTKRSHYGYDPTYLDEDLLDQIASSEGVTTPPPFNCGVVLLNGRIIPELARLGAILIRYSWRHTVWMALNALKPHEMKFQEGRGVEELRHNFRNLTDPQDVDDALSYPSANRWILEEVAVWLTFGHIENVTYADFSPTDVLQNGEIADAGQKPNGVIGHYFSQNLTKYAPLAYEMAIGQPAVDEKSRSAKGGAVMPGVLEVSASLMASPLVSGSGGYAVYEGLLDDDTQKALYVEAMRSFWNAKPDEYLGPPLGEGRSGHPPRRFFHGRGGPVQKTLASSSWLTEFLATECGMPCKPAGIGTYSYYTRAGDFIGLHLDVDTCDLVLITMLHDDSDPAEFPGAIVLYPGYIGQSLTRVPAQGLPGGVAVKLRVGQSMVMFGGLVPHYVAPIREGQTRVISVACFTALPGSET